MASHGAMKESAASEPARPRIPKKELQHIQMKQAENGGVIAEHHFTSYEHKPEPHVFGEGDGKGLAAHIEEHLGIKMPGRAKGTVAAPGDGEAREAD